MRPPRSHLPRGITRRNFLRSAAATSALLSAPSVLGAAGGDISTPPPGAGKGPFIHGVASGDPLSDRVILWTRVTENHPPKQIHVSYVVATDPKLRHVVSSGSAVATQDADYTVKVDVAGLQPNTTYFYRFTTRGGNSPIGRTKTLPVGSVDRLRIAVASCASLAHGYFNAYRMLAQRADLDVVVHLGDYIYEYGDGQYGDLRNYQPPTEIVTLREYRTRHNQYKADRDLQAMHRQHPIVPIWDDHEFADDAWQGGAANHQPDTEGAWSARVTAAVRAYYEWMPIRRVAQDKRRIFRSFRIGDLVELFMLEERVTARSQQVEPNLIAGTSLFTEDGEFLDPSRVVIGDPQQQWLIDGLRNSSAQWKLIGQGVMMAPARAAVTPDGRDVFFNHDQWDGYKPARDRLLGAIQSASVRNAVVLTGDIHSSWAADLPPDPYSDAYNALTGDGSLAVELVGTSVTSPGFDDPDGQAAAGLRSLNPHMKYIELTRHGYLLLDVTQQRVSGEWWYVDTIESQGGGESFATALQAVDGTNRLAPSTQSDPKATAPPLAP
ncbi:MAG TPA: alkaline phosphatase D family protein [Nevskiaceae bacterium]|nr:alkaline phosphatase D family protein [Nevskiaceae bacterium]